MFTTCASISQRFHNNSVMFLDSHLKCASEWKGGEKKTLEKVDLYVQIPFCSFKVSGANNLSVRLIKMVSPLFYHASPSFHCPGFTALERQTGGRCAGSLNRPKEVLTSSMPGSS